MLLERIRWEGVWNLADRQSTPAVVGSSVTGVAIAGEAGAGKTTWLEAVLAVWGAYLEMPARRTQWLSPRRASGATVHP